MPDAEGPGWALDTRLRPSGNQGLLVVSRAGFLRYHEKGAHAWERQALLKARPIGGDAELGAALARDIAEIAYGSSGDKDALAFLEPCGEPFELIAEIEPDVQCHLIVAAPSSMQLAAQRTD